MLNQTILVGRLANEPELKETETGKKMAKITLAVPRSYKNEEGIYETDFIDCRLWTSVAESTAEYCKKGDIIGVKGRIQCGSYERDDGERKYFTEVVAEKVTFLSSKRDEPEHEM